jgi:hypothetical protein
MGKAYELLFPIQRNVVVYRPPSYQTEMIQLLQQLQTGSAQRGGSALPFTVGYHLQALVQNGILAPSEVCNILGEVEKIAARSGTEICVSAIKSLSRQLPLRTLQIAFEQAGLSKIKALLQEAEAQARSHGARMEETINLDGRANIHRVMFTPAGMYFYGPEPVASNRVLRKYADHHDCFIRVQFCDEDEEPVRHHAQWSNYIIFYARFRKVLDQGFLLGGRRYQFLGFSHSSLRTQACWFMAPFVHQGSLLFDRELIRGLGDFTHIRCPAKCAARIGQAFSETPIAIAVEKGVAQVVADVERNGRVFSDGVGTISKSILLKLWAALPSDRKTRPTAFQIRFSGMPLRTSPLFVCFTIGHSVVTLAKGLQRCS